ncbi:MAG: translation initiation factor IF-3 [bacterium]|nr:translation initiation factor IF-3 [bacterium]
MRRGRKAQPKKRDRFNNRVNRQIIVPEVRLTGDSDAFESGKVYKTPEAQRIAEELGLDLIEISPKAKPPVCKIVELGKFKYELKKKQKDQEAKQREAKVETKEIRLGPTTGPGDLDFKRNHAISFLEDGNIVRLNMFFRGRMIVHKDVGQKLMLEFAASLEEYGVPLALPKFEGKRLKMDIKPKSKKKS